MAFQDDALFSAPERWVTTLVLAAPHGQDHRVLRVSRKCWSWWAYKAWANDGPMSCRAGSSNARAGAGLAPKPSLLLMDEPFSSLDTSMRESIAREVRAILKQAKATALMVTHDQNEAFAMADNVGVMARGQLMQWGNAVQVYCAPATQDVRAVCGRWCVGACAGHRWRPMANRTGAAACGASALPDGPRGCRCCCDQSMWPWWKKVSVPQVRERTFRGSHFVFELELPDGQAVMAKVSLNALYGACESVQIALSPELRGALCMAL